MTKLKYYLRAIWLWADIWDICWWHNSFAWMEKGNDWYIDCKTAWEVAHKIWLED